MDKQRRKELIAQYKEIKIKMGVFQIKNRNDGKIYLAPCPDLKNKWLTLKAQLTEGKFPNSALQRDWNALGEDAFSYEVLEEQEVKEDTDVRWELKMLEKKWLKKLEPYGEKGYRIPPRW